MALIATSCCQQRSDLSCVSLDTSEEFTVVYEFVECHSSDSAKVIWLQRLAIHSTGLYSFNQTSYLGWPMNVSKEGMLSSSAAKAIFDSIIEEGFRHMLDRYPAFGRWDWMEERLTVVCPSESKSVVFEGYSMNGLMSHTSMLLYNQMTAFYYNRSEPLDVTIDISVVPGPVLSPSRTEFSVSVTNNEDFAITRGGACTEVWPADIVRMNGRHVKDLCYDKAIVPEAVITVESGQTVHLAPQVWNWTGAAPGFYVVMVEIMAVNYVLFEVPASSGAVNNRPTAVFDVAPLKADVTSSFDFDATLTCDREDNSTDLMIRWDWEGDGVWDTDWSSERKYSHKYSDDGRYDATMQVKDSAGLTNETSQRVTVGDVAEIWLFVVLVGSALAVAAVAYLMLKRHPPPKA